MVALRLHLGMLPSETSGTPVMHGVAISRPQRFDSTAHTTNQVEATRASFLPSPSKMQELRFAAFDVMQHAVVTFS